MLFKYKVQENKKKKTKWNSILKFLEKRRFVNWNTKNQEKPRKKNHPKKDKKVLNWSRVQFDFWMYSSPVMIMIMLLKVTDVRRTFYNDQNKKKNVTALKNILKMCWKNKFLFQLEQLLIAASEMPQVLTKHTKYKILTLVHLLCHKYMYFNLGSFNSKCLLFYASLVLLKENITF